MYKIVNKGYSEIEHYISMGLIDLRLWDINNGYVEYYKVVVEGCGRRLEINIYGRDMVYIVPELARYVQGIKNRGYITQGDMYRIIPLYLKHNLISVYIKEGDEYNSVLSIDVIRSQRKSYKGHTKRWVYIKQLYLDKCLQATLRGRVWYMLQDTKGGRTAEEVLTTRVGYKGITRGWYTQGYQQGYKRWLDKMYAKYKDDDECIKLLDRLDKDSGYKYTKADINNII